MIFNLFFKQSIGEITNPDIKHAIEHVRHASSKKDALERAFKLITKRHRGYRFRTYIFFWKILEANPNKLWQRTGFMHCTQQNFLLSVLLIKSGWFSEKDLQLGHSLVWYISPHQYLKVKINDTVIAADPWNYRFGVSLGHFASGFGYSSL